MIRQSGLFDAAWYLAQYPDVALLGMDPLDHYLRLGAALRRDPGPDFDTAFCLDRYGDIAARADLAPLVAYLALAPQDNRPTAPWQLQARIADLEQRMAAEWDTEPDGGPDGPPGPAPRPALRPTPRPALSYCIPLMGRAGDLQATLADNLAAHAGMEGQVEFLIALFGDSAAIRHWIAGRFAPQIASGLLRLVTDDSLESWHFGKAKNAFRPHLRGRLYSSLDADNFVTRAETDGLLALDRQHQGHFLMHHFSGQWGDGTSGRISLPAAIYRDTGYDDRMLPRQFDEMDLVLRALKRHPAMPFLCIDPANHVFCKPGHAQRLFAAEALVNRILPAPPHDRRPPANPRGAGYSRAPHLAAMAAFNVARTGMALTTMTLTTDADRRRGYESEAVAARQQLIDTLPATDLADIFFHRDDRPAIPPLAPDGIALFTCLRDEPDFLRPFLTHYRDRGIRHAFVIDDGSAEPVATALRQNPVPGIATHVFRPKVGDFRTAKVLWIAALMRMHLPEGAWALTVDADEFIHLPPGTADFAALVRDAETRGADFLPGLLLDLAPAPDTAPGDLAAAMTAFQSVLTHCADVAGPAPADYASHRSVAWGFGPHADLSWRVDLRYHAFGTFDSLRKIPVLRRQAGRHLNQGFHTLLHTDGRPQPDPSIWTTAPVLQILHYKLARLYSDAARHRLQQTAGAYHDRSGANIARIFGAGAADSAARLLALPVPTVPVATRLARTRPGST